MPQFNLKDIHIFPVSSTGELNSFPDESLDFYTSALVYLLNDRRSIYIGESINIKNRFTNHNANKDKSGLLNRHVIYSPLFNKSVTLHLEAFLINHFAAEPSLKLVNVNLGNNGHGYHRKAEYESLFPQIWDLLRELRIAKTSFEQIINSNVFKYSPYKSLNTDQQEAVLACLRAIMSEKNGVFIHGNAGTGKTIIAIYLLKLLVTPIRYFELFEMKDEFSIEAYRLLKEFRAKHAITEENEVQLKDEMAIVVSMTSLRGTLQKVFSSIDQLGSNMVISPTDISKRAYKVVLVDEAHRLRQRMNLSGYGDFDKSNKRLGFDVKSGTELDWVLKQSDKQIFFYDKNQSIRKTDLPPSRFEALTNSGGYTTFRLHTQIRSYGGGLFTDFVHRLFDRELSEGERFESSDFSLLLFDRFVDMRKRIFQLEKEVGLSRLVAGFSWKYKTKSKKNRHLYDMVIEGVNLRWNSVAKDWINSKNAINEVGSIHTVFGNDLNYIAIVFGKEIDYDPKTERIIVIRENYEDINGKNNTNDNDLLFYIKNIYKTLMFRGIRGVYVYAINPNLKDYLARYIDVAEATSVVESEPMLFDDPVENSIPFYDLAIAAGTFSELQQTAGTKYFQLESFMDPTRYFACKVVGESMNKVIPNGSICVFEKYEGGSRDGLICLVESSSFVDRDFGANYTIKEYSSKKAVSEEGWQHQEIRLLPKSTDSSYKPIILRDEALLDLKVIGLYKRACNVQTER